MTKLSVFTPTHDPRHLLEAFESLRRQDYKDWEWVILPNSAGGETFIPHEIEKHPQVNVIPQTYVAHAAGKIGWLKNRACSYCNSPHLGRYFLALALVSVVTKNRGSHRTCLRAYS